MLQPATFQRPHILLSASLPALLLAACSAPAPQQGPVDEPAPAAQQPQRPADVPAEEVAATEAPGDAPQDPGPQGQENNPAQDYRAFGTEPFWSVRVENETLVFSTPEDQAGKTMQGKRVPSLRGFSFQGSDGGVEFNLDIQQAQCSDGMSDSVHKFESTFIYGDVTYRGCAAQAMAQ